MKIIFISLALSIVILLISNSCEMDRATIGSEQVQYEYSYINDYDYINNKYFFIDSHYVNYYEKGFSEDLLAWFYEEGTQIRELSVYKSASYADNRSIWGVATIPRRMDEFTDLNSIEHVERVDGEVEKEPFIALEEGKDFVYEFAYGFFILSKAVYENEVIAVAYKTDQKEVGTLFSTYSDSVDYLVLRLIKPRDLKLEHQELWPLMMKNVYSFSDSNTAINFFNIAIREKANQKTVQEENPQYSYLNLTGLDVLNANKSLVEGGDGMIDNHYPFINRIKGILTFPGLQPFHPLPESRFQLAESKTAQIYHITDKNNLEEYSKFEIVVQSTKN